MNKKILIIDDNKEILFAMSAICEYQNWVPITASNVMEGIERYKIEKPDIILMDYHLPILSGIEGVKKIRRLDKKIPIIVLTVEENQKVADRFIEVGASDFALKPIKGPDIISRINVHMRFKESIVNVNDEEDIYIKGISRKTLEKIKLHMDEKEDSYTINNIARGTGLAYQTVHRYLIHMEHTDMVKVYYKYGKVGRPKKFYKLKDNLA